ncbi:MAG: 8-oxo-dGTP diphosphatase [Christensenellaceae bacterium]|nr:8-oxo-dGTP diphosphatase [Christensenellaceae bacterium]
MHAPESVIMTNMCMIRDRQGNVVLQERHGDWPGLAFPGGHVENGESLTDAVIREIREETGLTIAHPRLCGVKNWFRRSGERYMVLLYRADEFTGALTSSEEGAVRWAPLDKLPVLPLAPGMSDMLRVFLEEDISEMYWSRDAKDAAFK